MATMAIQFNEPVTMIPVFLHDRYGKNDLRVLKIGRYSDAVITFPTIITRKKEELLLALSLLFIAMILASSLK
jgi:hypothetical protein